MILTVVGILVLGVILFFAWFKYTSPVNEAGREYRRNIKSYQNVEIETMDDVFERLEMLDGHFNSSTFNKVQGGEKREVTFSDIETLFGQPDQMVEDVDMNNIDTVYQYYYDDMTLNIHQYFRNIDEYIIEDFEGTFYDAQSLDQLFIDTVINHQSQYTKKNDEFEPIKEENVSQLMNSKTPTRKIRHSGWHDWVLNLQYYFDDGNVDYSPKEFLSFLFEDEIDEEAKLRIMERRYNEDYLEKDTQEEVEKKKEALFKFTEIFEEKEANNSDEKITIEDFSNEFGDIIRMLYDFREGTITVSWLIIEDDKSEEIKATVPIVDINSISDIKDLTDLEIIDFDSQFLYRSDRTLDIYEFIGHE